MAEGQNYSVSELKPLVLELDTDNYTFTLNGEKIKNGHSISTEASWELKATPIGESEATKTITSVSYTHLFIQKRFSQKNTNKRVKISILLWKLLRYNKRNH